MHEPAVRAHQTQAAAAEDVEVRGIEPEDPERRLVDDDVAVIADEVVVRPTP
jgi:hypothetical protein